VLTYLRLEAEAAVGQLWGEHEGWREIANGLGREELSFEVAT
jgi:hypothetical protein